MRTETTGTSSDKLVDWQLPFGPVEVARVWKPPCHSDSFRGALISKCIVRATWGMTHIPHNVAQVLSEDLLLFWAL